MFTIQLKNFGTLVDIQNIFVQVSTIGKLGHIVVKMKIVIKLKEKNCYINPLVSIL